MSKIVEEAIALSRKHHMQFVNLAALPKIPESTLGLMGVERAIRHNAIAISLNATETEVTVTVSDPDDTDNLEQIRTIMSPKEVIFYVATPEDLEQALWSRYSEQLVGAGN